MMDVAVVTPECLERVKYNRDLASSLICSTRSRPYRLRLNIAIFHEKFQTTYETCRTPALIPGQVAFSISRSIFCFCVQNSSVIPKHKVQRCDVKNNTKTASFLYGTMKYQNTLSSARFVTQVEAVSRSIVSAAAAQRKACLP